MTFAEEIALDTAAAIGIYGATFSWQPVGGASVAGIPCVRRDNPSALEILEAGGEVDLSLFTLSVAKLDLPPALLARALSLAAIGDGINGNVAQIGWINGGKDPNSPRITLVCKSYDSPRGGAA